MKFIDIIRHLLDISSEDPAESVNSHRKLDLTLPNHIAFIMDGNRRWAKNRSMTTNKGHSKGARSLQNILPEIAKLGIKYTTVYAFAQENWSRDKTEIDKLFKIIHNDLDKIYPLCEKYKIQVRHSGRIDKFPTYLQNAIRTLIDKTKRFNKHIFCVALDYSGRTEILEAFHKMKRDAVTTKPTNESFRKYLYQPDIPDPDFIIRTANEQRLSDFLLWQSAYSELYFTKTLWPDFTISDLHKALIEYNKRKRNFGK